MRHIAFLTLKVGFTLMSLQLFSPAKINLFLKVIRKRPDHYHDISSVLQTISLGDIITIQLSELEQDHLSCQNPYLLCDESNLIHKAIHLYRKMTGISQRFHVQLDKKIPMQAGLGGGSSNAATTLWACNRLCGEKASIKELMEWGNEIGSDVPFFFSQGTAFCTGRGENVMNLPTPEVQNIEIYKPKAGLSTAQVFNRLEISNNFVENSLEEVQQFLIGNFNLFNDLEIPAFQINPQLKALKNNLLSLGFKKVFMTGTGSSFVCVGDGGFLQNPDLEHFSAYFINRKLNEWYSLSKSESR